MSCILARSPSRLASVAVPQSTQKQLGSTLWAGHPFPCRSLRIHAGPFSLRPQKTSRYKTRNIQMNTWLRARGFAGPGLPEFRLPPQEVKALVQEQRFRQRLDKLLGGSSDRGLPDPEQYLTGSSNSPIEYRPARLTRTKASEATKAPATPHPKPRQSPATPLKPAVTRRRYTRKMPPR
jgi:hypothetical protein